jgi:hypothetical protein
MDLLKKTRFFISPKSLSVFVFHRYQFKYIVLKQNYVPFPDLKSGFDDFHFENSLSMINDRVLGHFYAINFFIAQAL